MQQVKKKTAKNNKKKTLYGDTIVEAILAISIYSIVAVLALSSMSSGLSSAQRNLESTMSRAAVDSQSDTLRYFYESYVATKSGKSDDSYYKKIWETIKPGNDGDMNPYAIEETDSNSCEELIQKDKERVESDRHNNPKSNIFVLSGRGATSSAKNQSGNSVYGLGYMDSNSYVGYQILGPDAIIAAPLYPRIVYKNMSTSGTVNNADSAMNILNGYGSGGKRQSRVAKQSEGVWIYPKATAMGYDFFVRTCWNPVGSKTPSTFTSVVRLYNAD